MNTPVFAEDKLAHISYMISGGIPLSHSAPSVALHLPESPAQKYFWEPVDTSGINIEMLKRQDKPILFFDEIIIISGLINLHA